MQIAFTDGWNIVQNFFVIITFSFDSFCYLVCDFSSSSTEHIFGSIAVVFAPPKRNFLEPFLTWKIFNQKSPACSKLSSVKCPKRDSSRDGHETFQARRRRASRGKSDRHIWHIGRSIGTLQSFNTRDLDHVTVKVLSYPIFENTRAINFKFGTQLNIGIPQDRDCSPRK